MPPSARCRRAATIPGSAAAPSTSALLVLTLPMALVLVPRPSPGGWAILAGAVVIHFIYKLAMALAYERAAYTVVYPVVRGSGPLVTVGAAAVIFGEHFTRCNGWAWPACRAASWRWRC